MTRIQELGPVPPAHLSRLMAIREVLKDRGRAQELDGHIRAMSPERLRAFMSELASHSFPDAFGALVLFLDGSRASIREPVESGCVGGCVASPDDWSCDYCGRPL